MRKVEILHCAVNYVQFTFLISYIINHLNIIYYFNIYFNICNIYTFLHGACSWNTRATWLFYCCQNGPIASVIERERQGNYFLGVGDVRAPHEGGVKGHAVGFNRLRTTNQRSMLPVFGTIRACEYQRVRELIDTRVSQRQLQIANFRCDSSDQY